MISLPETGLASCLFTDQGIWILLNDLKAFFAHKVGDGTGRGSSANADFRKRVQKPGYF